MSRYSYSAFEKQANRILKHQSEDIGSISFADTDAIAQNITDSEKLLDRLGYDPHEKVAQVKAEPNVKGTIIIPSWNELCREAEQSMAGECELEDLFTPNELRMNEQAIQMLNDEYNTIHRLDKYDIAISVAAGLISATIDILLVGIPQITVTGPEAAPLSDYIRRRFDDVFPEEEMQVLANSKVSKVPFDAQDNRNTSIYIEGLSAYYHRLLSLGHDPVLGLLFGTADILNGTMTTIDKNGHIVTQIMENYSDRTEMDIFSALAKQIAHFKSDVTTSMGLPAPFMALFNLLQFGSIGEEEQTIAEIVQSMYYEGYDFIHFCSQSIPVMLTDVIVRIGYAIKRIKEGHSIRESIPFSLNREKHPKLSTMLFISHSAATAINAGKVYFSKDPLAINYPQWLAFAKYSYSQLKWVILEKPEARAAYVMGKIDDDLKLVYADVDKTFNEISEDYILIFDS